MSESFGQRIAGAMRRGALTAQFLRSSGMFSALRAPALARHVAGTVRRPSNPTGILRLHALNTPNKPAVVDPVRGLTRTYAEHEERVNRTATAMVARGVGRGSRVAIMMRNCVEYLEVQWAATRIGAVAVQIGYRLKGPEVAYILENSDPAIFFCQSGEEAVAREAQTIAKRTEPLVVIGPDYESLVASGDPVTWPRAGGDDGSEHVLDLVDAACRGLLDDLRAAGRL